MTTQSELLNNWASEMGISEDSTPEQGIASTILMLEEQTEWADRNFGNLRELALMEVDASDAEGFLLKKLCCMACGLVEILRAKQVGIDVDAVMRG
jgi:hypothetical protein